MYMGDNVSLEIKNICCIGAGYVGGPTMAVIANKCPNIKVTVVDINQNKIANWNSEDLTKLPIFEPGLDLIIEKCRNRNLFFTTNLQDSIENADMIFISVNTPTKTSGVGAGKASDLKWVEESARKVVKYAKGKTIVVEKSTIPVRTAEAIKLILDTSNKSDKNIKEFSVLSNPEFLSEGNAIRDLENPDRVLIGGDDKKSVKSLVDIYKEWVSPEKILCTNIWSSELSKLAANAFLAQKISSINAISGLCEKSGANIKEVAKAIGMDSRIGSQFLNAGPGFGGSCFKKDILNLIYLSNFYKLPEVAEYWEKVLEINIWQQNRIVEKIVSTLFGTLCGKKIAILGFSFKANTNDTRESPSIKICKDLLREGANLSIYDPKVLSEQVEKELNTKDLEFLSSEINGSWEFNSCIYNAIEDALGIVVLTEWDEFKAINWEKVNNISNNPIWLFDTRNICNLNEALRNNIMVWSIGI